MSSLGQTLREAREAKGLTIAELSKKTHIMSKQLEGIERDDFSPIPAPIYVKSFIKTFATQVDLDPAEMVEKYLAQEKAGANPPPATPELRVKKSRSQARAEKQAAKEAAREAQAARAAEKAAEKEARAARKAEASARRKSGGADGLMPIGPAEEEEAEIDIEVEAEEAGLEEAGFISETQELLDFGDEDEVEDLEEEDLDVEDVEVEAPAKATRSARSQASAPRARKEAAAPQASTSNARSRSESQTWQPPERQKRGRREKPAKPHRPPKPAKPPRPSLSAVMAEKWKGVRATFAKWFHRDGTGYSIFGKTYAGETIRKAISLALLAGAIALVAYGALLVSDRMELRRAERGSSIGDLRTNPVITDPPEPYFITE